MSHCCETSFQTLLKPQLLLEVLCPRGLPQLQPPGVSHSREAQSASPAFYSPSAKFVLRDSKNHRKYKLCPRRAKLGHVQDKQGRNYHCDSHHSRANEGCWGLWDSLAFLPHHKEDVRKTQYHQDESKGLGQRQKNTHWNELKCWNNPPD